MRAIRAVIPMLIAGAAFIACNGTTGDELITFKAYAAGAKGASSPFTLNGFSVQLTSATMHIGAVYVDEAPLATGAESPICITPGIYAAQVPAYDNVDLLNEQPQEFSILGNGSADVGLSWQIWLTDGDINETNTTPMVTLQGTATRLSDQQQFPFGAVVTINNNRLPPASDPLAQPGASPICKQRIVLVGGIDVQFFQGGSLLVTIDPRPWFSLLNEIDFSTLPLVGAPPPNDVCLSADTAVPLDPSAYGPPACVPESSAGTCPSGSQIDIEDCTNPGSPCEIPVRCIPNTNFATGPGAQEGKLLFQEIQAGGSAAYSLAYSSGSP